MTTFRKALLALFGFSVGCSGEPVAPLPVTVEPKVASVRQLRDSAAVFRGMTQTVAVEILSTNLKVVFDGPVTWESSNPAVASVSPSNSCGLGPVRGCYHARIRGLEQGTAMITATAEGVSSSMVVRVVAPHPNAEGLDVNFEVVRFGTPADYAPLVTVTETAGRNGLAVVGVRIDFPVSLFCRGTVPIPARSSQTMFDELYGDYGLSFGFTSPLSSTEAQATVHLHNQAGATFSVTVSGPIYPGGWPTTYTGGNPKTHWECQ